MLQIEIFTVCRLTNIIDVIQECICKKVNLRHIDKLKIISDSLKSNDIYKKTKYIATLCNICLFICLNEVMF